MKKLIVLVLAFASMSLLWTGCTSEDEATPSGGQVDLTTAQDVTTSQNMLNDVEDQVDLGLRRWQLR